MRVHPSGSSGLSGLPSAPSGPPIQSFRSVHPVRLSSNEMVYGLRGGGIPEVQFLIFFKIIQISLISNAWVSYFLKIFPGPYFLNPCFLNHVWVYTNSRRSTAKRPSLVKLSKRNTYMLVVLCIIQEVARNYPSVTLTMNFTYHVLYFKREEQGRR